MNHLDEGTIHAWLDGALDATQARDVEGHVAQCATCSAAVAEARGLIAGSSRILNALDDVPSGVMPKRAAVAPARPAKRMWRAAPWVTGIAALFLGAVLLRTVDTQKATAGRARMISEPAPAADSAPVPPVTLPITAASPPPKLVASPATPRASAKDRRASAQENRQAASDATAGASTAQSVPATGRIAGAAASSANLAGVVVTGTRVEKALEKSAPMAPAAARSASVLRRGDVLQSTVMERTVGCYRIDYTATSRDAIASIAAEAAQKTRRAAPAAVASPRADFFALPSLPTIVQLDTIVSPSGLAVRAADSDSIIGSWSRIGDSLRVMLPSRGLFTLTASNRVVCPER